MKKGLLIVFFACQIAIAQEAGKAGELLKNQVTTQQKSYRHQFSWKAQQNSNFQRRNAINYRWNPNYGYTEVFLRIPEEGNFLVELGDQTMSNNTGRFRFFDVIAGDVPMTIYQNGFLIYRTHISAQANTRTVLDFFSDRGLFLLGIYPVGNQQYGINDWNSIWNDFYQNQPPVPIAKVMNDSSFSHFLKSLENNWFDDGKIGFIEQQAKNVDFTARQIKQLLQKLSIDTNRLALAKKLYHKCVDRENFFIVYESFDFDVYKKELTDYINDL